MAQAVDVTSGIYKDYTGGKYTVLFVATDSTGGREGNKVVVYVSLIDGKICCCDLDEFTKIVEWPDGGMKPRFIGAFSYYKKPTPRDS